MDHSRSTYALASFATVAWGATYVAAKYALAVIPSFSMLFLRYSIGILPLIFLMRREEAGIRQTGGTYKRATGRGLLALLAVGALGNFLAIALQFMGTARCSASLASLLNSTNPIVIILLAIPLLKEKPRPLDWLLVGVTLVGVAIIVGDIGEGNTLAGILLSLLSVLLWSLYSVLVRFLSQQGYTALQITVWGMAMAILLSLPIFVYQLHSGQWEVTDVDGKILLALLWIGIASTSGAFAAWNKALELGSAATCSLFYPLQPLTSALLGILLLGETLNHNFLLGGALIIGGVIASVLLPRPPDPLDSGPH